MANADHIKALIKSHADGDDLRFYSIALQVAAQAARSGHSKFAQELREIVDEVRRAGGKTLNSRAKPVPLVQPRGELAGLLIANYPKARLADMALGEELHQRVERVLREQHDRDRLREHGFSPIRKLLLLGPPGTGKTMTASVLAGELGLPLFTVQLHGIITKYMGETAAKLRLVFDAIAETRAVYLFDEFDALGGERASQNDVGEIRRVLNSFLQFLEQDDSDSLILGATNHPALLDRALFRRFDGAILYELPTPAIVERLLRGRLALLDTSVVDWSQVVASAHGLSHGELVRACEHAAKNALLDHRTQIASSDLTEAIADRRISDR
ncbi:MAG: AAA family ATPase [Myxococcota bacterium]|nr:AAA family ATPase [Myxococcota bacterium]